MPDLEDFCDLLFEISNEDRLRIMEELDATPLHATGVSRRLDIPTQEASRHLLRLAEVGLIAKSPPTASTHSHPTVHSTSASSRGSDSPPPTATTSPPTPPHRSPDASPHE